MYVYLGTWVLSLIYTKPYKNIKYFLNNKNNTCKVEHCSLKNSKKIWNNLVLKKNEKYSFVKAACFQLEPGL